MTLHLLMDRHLARAGVTSTRYVLARITAPTSVRHGSLPPANVALVLDRSGSMQGDRKFPLAKEAVERALALLRPCDRFSIVVFDSDVDVVHHSTLADASAKRRALDALSSIEPRSSTHLSGGWFAGCDQVARFMERGSVSRVLLLTDGMANCGVTQPAELGRHAAELRLRGVSTTTFGVGADFNEHLLAAMSREGGGNFYFIGDAAQIPAMLTGELQEALDVTVHGASLVARGTSGLSVEVLNRLRSTGCAADGEGGTRVELGDLVSGQSLAVVLAVRVPPGRVGTTASLSVALEGDGIEPSPAPGYVTWTYDTHPVNDAQLRNVEVDREVAALYSAQAKAEATEANRQGDLGRAREVLRRTRSRVLRYAHDDPRLLAIATDLQEKEPVFSDALMSPRELKASHFAEEVALRGRGEDGRARR